MFVIHIGASGFPYDSAQIQRIRLTFKSLKLVGCNPLIINKNSIFETDNTKGLNRFQGIPYINTSFSKTRLDGFVGRNLNKLSGFIGEFIVLLKKRKKIQTAIFYHSSLSGLIYYRVLSKILRFKLILHYVEFRSTIPGKSLLTCINNKLFDNYCFNFCDGIIVISEFLRRRAISKNKSLPILKIPAICDFSEFDIKEDAKQGDYLMYCGGIGYLPVINFIIDLFCRLKYSNLYNGNLVFAIGYGDEDIPIFNTLVKKINDCKYRDYIELKTNVQHRELVSMYLAAELLIVPLRNIDQDIAGFHHKVGEYSAAGKPIISTNIGELKYYFLDGVSAILADEYSIDSYISKLSEVIASKDKLKQIGEEGHKLGLEKFDYKAYANDLKLFIKYD